LINKNELFQKFNTLLKVNSMRFAALEMNAMA